MTADEAAPLLLQPATRPPDPSLDPYLDAFAAVAARFGVRRTTALEVAREAGVDRTTIFRNVGPVEELQRAYLAREGYRFVTQLIADVPVTEDGPGIFVDALVLGIEGALAHPVLAKVLADEHDLVGQLLPGLLPDVIDMIVSNLEPALAVAHAAGLIHCPDEAAVAQWIARFGITVVVAPPADLRATIDAVLRPMLAR